MKKRDRNRVISPPPEIPAGMEHTGGGAIQNADVPTWNNTLKKWEGALPPGAANMIYPGAGVAVSTGANWDVSKANPSGALVGTTDAQTLTNKNLADPTNTFPAPPTGNGWRHITNGAEDPAASVPTKADVGLGNCDNTSDANKPISTATQAALDLKAPINNPNFTGVVTGVTKAMVGLSNVTDDAQIPKSIVTMKGDLVAATASGVLSRLGVGTDNKILTADSTQPTGMGWKDAPGGAAAWGSITGTLSNQTDLQTALNAKEATANKGAVNGYAPLDGSAKVPSINLPNGLPSIADWLEITTKPHITPGDDGYGATTSDLIGAIAAIGSNPATLIIPKGADCSVTPLYTLSVVCNTLSGDKKISRTSGSWVVDGVKVGHWIEITGGADYHTNGYKQITSVSALDLVVNEGVATENSVTLSIVNRAVIPSNVTLRVEHGGTISIGAREVLLFLGNLTDCAYQIFDDANTYNYGKVDITSWTGSPVEFTAAGHGLENGDLVYLCTGDAMYMFHHHFYVANKTLDTFKLQYQNKTSYITDAGTRTSGDNIRRVEAYGVKFMGAKVPFVRPEWWGATAMGSGFDDTTKNGNAFNRALHNTFPITYAGYNIDNMLPVMLSTGTYKVKDRLWAMAGASIYGVASGFSGPLMYKSFIEVDGTSAYDSFIYVWNIGDCYFRDFALLGPGDSVTMKKGIEIGGDKWHSNGTKLEHIGIANFAPADTANGWAVFCNEGTSYLTRLFNCGIGSNGNGVRVEADSEILLSNFVGNAKGIAIWNVGAQIRDCVIEVWQTGIKNDLGGMITGCLIKQIAGVAGAGACIDLGPINSQVTISNNILSTSYRGIAATGELYACNITNNQFDHIGHQLPEGQQGYAVEAKGFYGCIVKDNVFGKCRFGPVNLLSPGVTTGPGCWKDNYGLDLWVPHPPPLIYPPGFHEYQPVAMFSDRFRTNNTATKSISNFFGSGDVGREISVTFGDRNTKIAEWLTAISSHFLPQIYVVKGGTWDTTDHYFGTTNWYMFASPTAQVDDALYLGDDNTGQRMPIGLKLNIKVASAGNTIVAEYWDGYEWMTLPTRETPNIFATTGSHYVRWMPPPIRFNFPAGGFENLKVSVDAVAKTFTCTDIESFMQPWTALDRPRFMVGDWIITTGFADAGNNGKFQITALDRYKITCGNAGTLVTVTDDLGVTFKIAGLTNFNLNQGAAVGVPAGGPNTAANWVRLRCTAGVGGQCTIGDVNPYYNLMALKSGDFGPLAASAPLDCETIRFKWYNGSWIELDRTAWAA